MVTNLDVMTIKPGDEIHGVKYVVVSGDAEFPILKDDVIFIGFTSETDNELTIYGGNGVFAGGDKKIFAKKDQSNYFYMESGPYARYEDGKTVVRINAASAMYIAVIQAV